MRASNRPCVSAASNTERHTERRIRGDCDMAVCDAHLAGELGLGNFGKREDMLMEETYIFVVQAGS